MGRISSIRSCNCLDVLMSLFSISFLLKRGTYIFFIAYHLFYFINFHCIYQYFLMYIVTICSDFLFSSFSISFLFRRGTYLFSSQRIQELYIVLYLFSVDKGYLYVFIVCYFLLSSFSIHLMVELSLFYKIIKWVECRV